MNQDVPELFAPFDPDKLRQQSLQSRLLRRLFDDPRWLFALLRWVCPIARLWWPPRLRQYALVTRNDDVREVMSNDAVFGVPYQAKIEALAGANFMLGMDNGPSYRDNLRFTMQAFQLADVPAQARTAAEQANHIVAQAPGKLDAMSGLVIPVLAGICESYYGIPIADPRGCFPLWAMAASNYLFNPFDASPDQQRQASAGAERLRAAVDRGIDRERANPGDTIIGRLLREQSQSQEGTPDDATIRSIVVSLVTAIVPTGTLAAGNILEMLLRRNDFMKQARDAAAAGDDELLSRCIFEALRFKPVSPWWRRDSKEDFVLAADTRRQKLLPKGTRVLASTFSAMFDQRQIKKPNDFDPGRSPSDYMLFGYGLHYCLGASFASAVIPAIIKPLLLCQSLAASGERGFFGVFPERLDVIIGR